MRIWMKKHRKILLFILFGGVTTAVNWIVYIWLYSYTQHAAFSNGIAWLAAVIVAYLTNKFYVFENRNCSFKLLVPEFGRFFTCRFTTGFLETVCMFVFSDLLHVDGVLIKLLVSACVVALNYFSGFLSFKC